MIHKRRKILSIVLLILLIGGSVGIYYYLTPYHAESEAIDALSNTSTITVTNKSAYVAFEAAKTPKANLIFYPGALVEPESYAPLAKRLAEMQVNTYIVKMPLNLAILGVNKAQSILSEIPYAPLNLIGGHSLGGAMAASYASKHPDQVDGLVLLAAYANDDLSGSNLQALSLFGSKDQVLNRSNYEKNWSLLPPTAMEHIIEGGNHAQFGDYGFQKGDAPASISSAKQWNETAKTIVDWLSAFKS